MRTIRSGILGRHYGLCLRVQDIRRESVSNRCRTQLLRPSMSAELLDLLCRNSLHPRTGSGPCGDCSANPQEGVVLLGVAESRRLFGQINFGYRQCPECGETKPLPDDFSNTTTSTKTGMTSRCKACVSGYSRAWRAQVASDGSGRNSYRRRLLRDYNITPGRFDEILASQGRCCAICGSSEPHASDWAIDHDHACCPTRKRSCGKCVRGLLCVRCNVGLSYFSDNPEALSAAGEYIRTHRRRRPSTQVVTAPDALPHQG
jgi:hypothetical protein